jgi:mRNA interferase RelE/StbE
VADIAFTDPAIDDLRRLGPSVAERVLKKLLILEEDACAGPPLGDALTGFRKLVVGNNTWRIVYRVDDSGAVEVCEIWAAGERSDSEVYREATARVQRATQQRPELIPLVEVIARLGRLAGGAQAPERAPEREPVPDWLATKLVYTAGYDRAAVAAMDGPQALACWERYITSPRQ